MYIINVRFYNFAPIIINSYILDEIEKQKKILLSFDYRHQKLFTKNKTIAMIEKNQNVTISLFLMTL